jgi:uncharacterized protein YggU (UPF0235/DUF167 family)
MGGVGEQRFAIRVRPGASRTSVGGSWAGGALVVAVTERAVDGRATEAALRAVADALGVRRGDVSLVRGATSRDKLVAVDPAPADLPERVSALRDGQREPNNGE